MYANLEGKYIILNETSTKYGMAAGGIKPITRDIHDEIIEAMTVLSEFNLFKRKTLELRLNYESLCNSKKDWLEKVIANEGEDSIALVEPIFIDVNRRLTNFIVSLKTLIDDILIKNKLPKIFPKDSVDKFKAIVSTWYDEILAYKFFVRLRDYAVHSNMPIQIVRFDYDFNENRTPKTEIIQSIKFRKSILFANSKFRSKLEEDLNEYDETFALDPFLDEIKIVIDELLLAIVQISNCRYINAVTVIESQIGEIPNKASVSVGTVIREGDTVGPRTKLINLKTIDLIKSINKKTSD